jgi:phosphoribosylaminoimidazolecarboxamide formyltransferase / IMP cyclohydrolase
VIALTRDVDRAVAEALTTIFLEVVIAPAYTAEALEVLATKPNLRVLVDELLASDDPIPPEAASPTGSIRTAGGAVLVTAPDIATDMPTAWTCVTRRPPTGDAQVDLDLAWRLVRGVTSNAIALVRDRRLVGMGSGQTSRVDAARQAVAKAHALLGPTSTAGAVCASDAFFPFPDAVEVCLEAGIRAFAQPGGSIRDAETVDAVDRADGTMLITGVRHFRH